MSVPATVLVVEDSEDMRFLFERALAMENYRVLMAEDGREGLRILEGSQCPDLVLLDLSMPHMDGAEFIRHLRAHDRCAQVKVAIVSGWDNLAARATKLGADGYVRKPIDLNTFLKEVARLVPPRAQDQDLRPI
jgi:two-component system KDP operon response regulator KdpE